MTKRAKLREMKRLEAALAGGIERRELRSWRDAFYFALGFLGASGFDSLPFEAVDRITAAAGDLPWEA